MVNISATFRITLVTPITIKCLPLLCVDSPTLPPDPLIELHRDEHIWQIGKPRADNSEKPAVWIDAGIHAREWIAPATLIYTIHKVSKSNLFWDKKTKGWRMVRITTLRNRRRGRAVRNEVSNQTSSRREYQAKCFLLCLWHQVENGRGKNECEDANCKCSRNLMRHG